MANSYKLRTYPTLKPWIPLHKEIIEQYEMCPNKAEFMKMALEYFAESGFPGLQSGKPPVLTNSTQKHEVITNQRKVEIYDDPLSEL